MPTVRLVDADKEMLGVFSREDALKKAEEAGLDLVRCTAALEQGIGLAAARHACSRRAAAMRRR